MIVGILDGDILRIDINNLTHNLKEKHKNEIQNLNEKIQKLNNEKESYKIVLQHIINHNIHCKDECNHQDSCDLFQYMAKQALDYYNIKEIK